MTADLLVKKRDQSALVRPPRASVGPSDPTRFGARTLNPLGCSDSSPEPKVCPYLLLAGFAGKKRRLKFWGSPPVLQERAPRLPHGTK